MGRCKNFEEEEVLRKALECFLEKGYQATSTRDLAQAMGISYGSVYNTFRDKRTLYLVSLDLYIRTFTGPLIHTLDTATNARKTLAQILNPTISGSVSGESGCFIGNAIMLLASHDVEVAQKVQGMNTSIEKAIERLLRRAYEAGEINPTGELANIAHFMVNTLFGIRLMVRLDNNPERLSHQIEVALSVI